MKTNSSDPSTSRDVPKLLMHDRVIAQVYKAMKAFGWAGERRNAAILYLAIVSRLLDKPVSVIVKGPSSGGKTGLVECIAGLFLPSAATSFNAMTDKALIYSEEDLRHRMVIIFEAQGLSAVGQEIARTFLSEGRIRYQTVLPNRKSAEIIKEGPTGLITTMTADRWHPENETRMLSLFVEGTSDQTRDVFRSRAEFSKDECARRLDQEAQRRLWRKVDRWLRAHTRPVKVPYEVALAELFPAFDVTLRRAHQQFLSLLRAHALLHQQTRKTSKSGAIIASIADYRAVKVLLAPIFAKGLKDALPDGVGETIAHIAQLQKQHGSASVTNLARLAGVEKSTITRRVAAAKKAGYVRDQATKRGSPSQLVLARELPDRKRLLPSSDAVKALQKKMSSR